MTAVVVGGAGFVGSAVCRLLCRMGESPVVVDISAAPAADVLVDDVVLPPGRVVLALGRSLPRPVRPWTLVRDNALATARLTAQLLDRDVTLLSSVEVYGWADGPLSEDTPPRLPATAGDIADWCDRAVVAAARPCPPYRSVALCRDLSDRDPSGRWVYALAKTAQEEIVRRAVPAGRLTVLRCANVVGVGQWRFLARLVDAVLDGRTISVTDTSRSFVSIDELARAIACGPGAGVYNVSSGVLGLAAVADLVSREVGRSARIRRVPAPVPDSCGVVDSGHLQEAIGPLEDVGVALRRVARELADRPVPMFAPPLPVILPPRPERPDIVADRMAASLWAGSLRGGRWSARLTERLGRTLNSGDRPLLLTNSGTNALRLAVESVAGEPVPGDEALCPAYTFYATAEVLRQLGFRVRLVDVDPQTWTMDPARLANALGGGRVRVVVAVDALGNPCDYAGLLAVCRRAGVPLVADSAAALGSRYAGVPVGSQADAHAFSMSFAKVVSGGGSGGAVVLPVGAAPRSERNWLRSSAITELSAVVALDNVEALDELVGRRRRVADAYEALLAEPDHFTGQYVRVGDRHSHVHWVVQVHPRLGRDRLATELAAEGVATKNYYEPLSVSPPVTAALHQQSLALPMSSELCLDDAERVAAAVLRSVRRLAPSPVVDLTAPAMPARTS